MYNVSRVDQDARIYMQHSLLSGYYLHFESCGCAPPALGAADQTGRRAKKGWLACDRRTRRRRRRPRQQSVTQREKERARERSERRERGIEKTPRREKYTKPIGLF